MKYILLSLVFLFSAPTFAVEEAETLKNEFERLYQMVEQLEPEFDVGGYLNGKKYGNVELLWKLGEDENDSDVIRLFVEDKEGQDFVISYHRGTHLVKGRNVLRRFYGPVISGWRNDSIDLNTDEYLGWQGVRSPMLTERDKKVLQTWNVSIF